MAGRVAGIAVGLAALFSIAAPAHAQAQAGGTGITVPPPDPIAQPQGTSHSGGAGSTPTTGPPQRKSRSARPVLTLFTASAAATAPSGAVIQFRVTDRARSVRVRLAFVSLADRTTYRVNLGVRRTVMLHTYTWTRKVAPGTYRVRITARNRRGKKAVRSTTVQVNPPAPVPATNGTHRFPIVGAYDFGGPGSRFGAARNGHIHQGQDVTAAEGTPLVAVATGTITWRAYQADGAGYYLVLAADGEPYNYVYMHLQQGSLLVAKGDRVAAGQRIASVGNTGGSEGPHLHFEVWDGPWYAGGHPVDPLPFLKSWE